MNTPELLAQWVVDNRNSKKVRDIDLYNTLVRLINNMPIENYMPICETCTWVSLADKTSICSVCGTKCPF